MAGATLVRRYYACLDDHEYATLESLLTPEFVQVRPDRTFEGREAFVQFMREGRPNPETSHEVASVIADGEQVAARGRVVENDRALFEFADFFELTDDRITRLETFVR